MRVFGSGKIKILVDSDRDNNVNSVTNVLYIKEGKGVVLTPREFPSPIN